MQNSDYVLHFEFLSGVSQANKTNSYSSFFILHSSFSPEGVLFSTAKHIVKQKPKSVTLCILQVKRESIIWKKKGGDKQILKICLEL